MDYYEMGRYHPLHKKIIAISTSILVVVVALFSAYSLIPRGDYIDGNVINFPYSNSWSEDDLLDNPWRNNPMWQGLMHRSLLIADSTLQYVSLDLASDYQLSADGMTYTFILPDDLLWSDGMPITIDDLIFSIEGVCHCDMANSIYKTAFSNIEGGSEFLLDSSLSLTGLEQKGNSLIIHMATPYPQMDQILAQLAILPAHCFEGVDYADIYYNDYWKDPVVSGMYMVDSVDPGETVTLTQNPNYGGVAPQIETVILHVNYKLARLDYYSTNDITEIINYRSMRSMTEYPIDILFYRYFIFNVQGADGNSNEAMADPLVREAIAYAIDREDLLYDVYLDSGTLIDSGVPATYEAYDGISRSYDPDKARELLAESSYDLSRPLRLTYYYTDTTSKRFMEGVAEDLEAVGFTVDLFRLDAGAELYDQREYDLALKGLSAFDISEWYAEYGTTHSTFSQIFNGLTVFDEPLAQLNATTDETLQNEILLELQSLEHQSLYKIPLFTLGQVLYINEDRVNIPTNVTFGNTWYKYNCNFENWTINRE